MNFSDIVNQNPCYPVFGSSDVSGDIFQFADKITSKVKIIQLREKDKSTLDFFNTAKQISNICKKNNCALIINDRIDIAIAVDADGVHIGQDDMPYEVARKMIGQKKIIGLTIDYKDQLKAISYKDLDYIGVGAIFQSSTKDTKNIHGPDGLKSIKQASSYPVIAIGGITEQNIESIRSLCDGFAVVSEITRNHDPVKKIGTLISKFYDQK